MTDWLNGRDKGWLGQHPSTQPKPIKRKPQPQAEDDILLVAVTYVPTCCPKCQSPDTKITRTDKPVRYHKCTECGQNFKSVQEV